MNLIHDPDALWKRLGIIAHAKNISLLTAGGTANHVHLLIALSPVTTLSSSIQNLKAHTSRWMKEDVPAFAWQEGYAAFTVSASQKERVRQYIQDQKTHHLKLSFKEELVAFLIAHEIEFEEKYLWD